MKKEKLLKFGSLANASFRYYLRKTGHAIPHEELKNGDFIVPNHISVGAKVKVRFVE